MLEKATENGLIHDEGRMQSSGTNVLKTMPIILEKITERREPMKSSNSLKKPVLARKVPESWISGADQAPSPFPSQGLEQR